VGRFTEYGVPSNSAGTTALPDYKKKNYAMFVTNGLFLFKILGEVMCEKLWSIVVTSNVDAVLATNTHIQVDLGV
jgi:hypothetical protein